MVSELTWKIFQSSCIEKHHVRIKRYMSSILVKSASTLLFQSYFGYHLHHLFRWIYCDGHYIREWGRIRETWTWGTSLGAQHGLLFLSIAVDTQWNDWRLQKGEIVFNYLSCWRDLQNRAWHLNFVCRLHGVTSVLDVILIVVSNRALFSPILFLKL